ncbi:unnamed protein product [Rotaria magnacalcarata]|uniref:Uncharacterized protein n=1 Tax=Rotaria magnacalcarata TaxID=392030 RepID=A0A8S2NH90_9BILA|nr:unnamed protein product [Rotaria magnacalcarata]
MLYLRITYCQKKPNENKNKLIGWFRLLPNIKCLYVDSSELKYWFTNDYNNQYLDSFLRNLDRLYVDCSSIVNINLNEEILVPLLSLIIGKHRFPQLQYLRFIKCKHISSAWSNVHKWIDFIFTHINEHQLKCLRFDFTEKDNEVTDMKADDEIITVTESPPCVVDIHRFVSENHISYWIERKYK